MPTCVKCNLCGADDSELLFIEKGWHIVKCRRCGLLYANPRPSSDELREFYREGYSRVGPNYLAKRESKLRRARRELRKIARYKKKGKLLDIGCGAGFFLKEAQKKGWDVFGVDLSQSMIEYAKKEFHLKGLPKNKINHLPEMILERDKEQRVLRSTATQAMSDAVTAQKRPGPSGSPIFKLLRRCFSAMCHRHITFLAPCTNFKSGTPNSQHYFETAL